MTDQVVSVLPCPYCVTGEATVAVHLRAVRAVMYAEVLLGPDRPAHPAVAFRGAPAGPCPHLVRLAVGANWARDLRPGGGPAGALRADWRHPEAERGPVELSERLGVIGRRAPGRRRSHPSPRSGSRKTNSEAWSMAGRQRDHGGGRSGGRRCSRQTLAG